MDTFYLIVFGALVHLVFFYSIFDIYFTSPLVHGMKPYRSPLTSPAKRLVLFVADGLRADKFFELDDNGQSRAKYLRNIIEKHGSWGVSHTHVPTESRPGHVALIAGFFEDVSAVAKGWKENPVEFDSVFNESKYTWSWGSPDILPMFAKGATGSHVFTHCYHGDQEDFAGSDSSKLDTWVFDRVKEFLVEGKTNTTLQRMLNNDKIVFFLHLLGIDTNGHSHKPHSQEYLNNIKLMDAGIENIVSIIEEFYKDNKTAYVMSSDHGMTNWGSHGAGHQHETLTPLVAWGAGVRKPVHQPKNEEDKLSIDWRLDDIKRSDVEQADVAALMASLIGIPYPLNSVGILPVDYLDATDEEKAEHMFANALQILAQYQVKMEEKKSTTLSFVFRPYSELTPGKQADKTRHIQSLIQKKLYTESIKESQSLIKLALDGLHYYQKYDRFFLGLSITCGFLGWMTYVMTLIIEDHTGISRTRVKLDDLHRPYLLTDRGIKIVFLSVALIIIFLLFIQSLPWTNYLYCLIPVLLWMLVFLRFDILIQLWQKITTLQDLYSSIIAVLLCCFGLEILVAGFFQRELLSIGLISMAVWGVISYRQYCKDVKDKVTVFGWFFSCVVLAVFPLLPVVGRETNYNLVVLGGLATIYCGIYASRSLPVLKTATNSWEKYVYYIQIGSVVSAIFIVKSTSISISNKEGLPYLNQILSWITLGGSVFIPLLSSTKMLHRLLSIGLAFIPPYLLLSISQETLFVICLCWLLHCWLRLENLIGGSEKQKKLEDMDFVNKPDISESPRYLLIEDIRRAFYYIFFILTGFFGTGNIASINSFEPASVYCFLTVFNPFVMGALMLLKNILPLILVSCAFHAIHIITSVPTRALFLLVLIMSDFMALNFFFLVRDYGSWLEIGTSISHYIIVMCMNIFLMMLYVVSQILTSFKFFNKKHHCY